MTDGIVVLSGGLDSTTLLYHLMELENGAIDAVSFDYGQRHRKELAFARATCEKLGVRHTIVELSHLASILSEGGSSLVNKDVDVPEGHYAQENMKQTVVPNRNMIMLSIAGGIAVARKAKFVATAVHAGDHFIYPDCRPDFIDAVSDALELGNEGFENFGPHPILTPFSHWTKANIALDALQHDVPLEETWSCYKGGEIHCGRCGTCVERLEAIDLALRRINNVPGELPHVDSTEYEDNEYWKVAVIDADQA